MSEVVDSESDQKEMLKKSQSHDDIGKLKEKFINIPYLKDLTPGNPVRNTCISLYQPSVGPTFLATPFIFSLGDRPSSLRYSTD